MSKKLQRMCVACRIKKEKSNMLRVAQDKNNNLILDNKDNKFKAFGRGAYVCCNKECIKKAQKILALSRALKCNADNNIFEELLIAAAAHNLTEQ
ncbi:MAG: YlxR family protein [Oscillospiraceae bacterium]